MGISPAVAFTTILLALMIGAGVVSSSWGYALGRQALTGVRQPDTRPASSAASDQASPATSSGPMLRDEQEIIQDVKLRMSGTPAESGQ
ncbi:hypothetical protein PN498_17385 [Oscillatoria sp. CS-180]|uniref:hypothetical protein n=1 Tax=Oscillatoria sp. CS-180 TaxID=3021720 RepID=UPI00232FCE5B|nr:hypothetical protein [Oscillatoria sp. CS-180]MDB9527772.1 hypothetical protein [Oscillatoria sp. CS-180]